MAWEEWEQLKAQALERKAAQMQLNQVEPGMGGGPGAAPDSYGDLRVNDADLAKIGEHAFDLFDRLSSKGDVAVPSSQRAGGDLTEQGFALGGGLQHVAKRWEEQLNSLRDACAHISNHMRVTKKLHQGDEHYIRRQLSSIDLLDAGFDERAGQPGKKNPVYLPPKKQGDN
ncbi:hypothetical protein [Streptomyces alboflavus]|uniref:hypothetical protein n=1 Tax=Streptomyces alboflavus TaxID=67267 RepID=UPI000F658BD2|nr:hypothetical protein [Streptomyces alboflavus]